MTLTQSEGLRLIRQMDLTAPQRTFERGDTCRRFRIEGGPSRGGHAEVYSARDIADDNAPEVAIKVMRREANWRALRNSFALEAHILERLKDVVGAPLYLIEKGRLSSGQDFLIMPWVEGMSLHLELGTEFLLSSEHRVVIARDVAKTLADIHGIGIVHRDLNPRNVLFHCEPTAGAAVCDFGVAADLTLKKNLAPAAGQRFGTDGFVSPEQTIGAPPLPSTDIWSLGAIMLVLATGEEASESDLYRGKFPTQPDDPLRARLHELALRCLVVDPTQRPAADGLFGMLERLNHREDDTQPYKGNVPYANADGEIDAPKVAREITALHHHRTPTAPVLANEEVVTAKLRAAPPTELEESEKTPEVHSEIATQRLASKVVTEKVDTSGVDRPNRDDRSSSDDRHESCPSLPVRSLATPLPTIDTENPETGPPSSTGGDKSRARRRVAMAVAGVTVLAVILMGRTRAASIDHAIAASPQRSGDDVANAGGVGSRQLSALRDESLPVDIPKSDRNTEAIAHEEAPHSPAENVRLDDETPKEVISESPDNALPKQRFLEASSEPNHNAVEHPPHKEGQEPSHDSNLVSQGKPNQMDRKPQAPERMKRKATKPQVDCVEVMNQVRNASQAADWVALGKLSKKQNRHCWPSHRAWQADRFAAISRLGSPKECRDFLDNHPDLRKNGYFCD